jgi:hypothetical protein
LCADLHQKSKKISDPSRAVPVPVCLTPRHHAQLIPELAYLVDSPPDHDHVIRTLSRKLSNGLPLIQGDLVIAGKDTMQSFPRAREYPVHFRKTYYPTAFHPPATLEFEKHERISRIIDVPPPIGATRNCFRSCFIPGVPLSRLSPFGVEPAEQNLLVAAGMETAALIGLWHLLEEVSRQVAVLHEHGVVHGDLFLHNVIVSRSPVAVCLIDFEQAVERAPETDADGWAEREAKDLEEVLRHALWVQAGLGAQPGLVGECSRREAGRLLGPVAGRCLQAIEDHSTL